MKNTRLILLSIIFLFSLHACKEVGFDKKLNINQLNLPASVNTLAPFLFQNEETVLLSWIDSINDSLDALVYVEYIAGQWSEPKEIVRGNDWFVNWADFPSLVKSEGILTAHWLQKSASGTYDYNIQVKQSKDDGASWSEAFLLNHDGVNAEHGFVSLLPVDSLGVFATWLDGRFTKSHEADDTNTHEHGLGAMTLRGAFIDTQGQIQDDTQLDSRVCDCCQTSTALTNNGIIVAYRDRSERERRDISIVRNIDNEWTEPYSLNKDNWMIKGCPVNGPKIAAQGDKVAIAWYTNADEQSKVKLAFSKDNGASFGSPVILNDSLTLGRVDLQWFDDTHVLITWLEMIGGSAQINFAKVHKSGLIVRKERILASSDNRSSGFPKFVVLDNQSVLLARTSYDTTTLVETYLINTF